MPLITRQGKGSKLTIQEMDGNLNYLESLGFPYEGDATISGSWEFETPEGFRTLGGDNIELASFNYLFQGNALGNFHENQNEGLSIYNYIADGEVVITDPPISFPIIGNVMGLESGSSRLQIGSRILEQSVLGGDDSIQNVLESEFEIDGLSNAFTIQQSKNITDDFGRFELNKTVIDLSSVFSGISLFTEDGLDNGFTIGTNIDDEIKLFRILDDEADEVLGVTQLHVVMEKVVDYNYADDAAAETAGVPVGGIYHTNGTLKIRLS